MVKPDFDILSPTVEQLLQKLDTNLMTGLSDDEVSSRLQKYGHNELPEEEKTGIFALILEQFEDTLVRILLLAAIVSAAVGLTESNKHWLDAFVEPSVILVVLIVNAIVSIRQTLDAEEAIKALKEYEPDIAKVLRSSSPSLQQVNAKQLVLGDIVEVRVGDRAPADLRVCAIHSSILRVDQSILTGESESIIKHGDPVTIGDPVNQEKHNIVFSGTNIVAGRATCVVVSTGLSTEIGKIRENLIQIENARTPLQVKLDEFGNQLSLIILIICVFVWVINIHHFDDAFHGNSWFKGAVYYFKIAISLAVAAIPEGLPAVITTCLAIGTRRMAKNNAIVRTLRSVETLGCTTVICTDKTGTITTNQMAVRKIFLPATSTDGKLVLEQIGVSGASYDFRDGTVDVDDSRETQYGHSLKWLTRICCLCNDANLSIDCARDVVTHVGEATEAALLVLAEKLNAFDIDRTGMSIQEQVKATLDECNRHYSKEFTLEFSRNRKSMSVYCREKTDGTEVMLVKGAPEDIIERCSTILTTDDRRIPLSNEDKAVYLEELRVTCSGKDMLRCLGLALIEKPVPLASIKTMEINQFVDVETNMVFVGVVGMLDPPRPEVLGALDKCAQAGVRVIVITGDNMHTAEAICHRVGIFRNVDDLTNISFSARQFSSLSQLEKLEMCKKARLFSRVEPSHKSEIVSCLQELGEVTAMTGDGVNDAPALKKAEIGVAMGSGTAVAKSSADIVLTDDNFTSIVAAVSEGRAIFHNTVQFISYLISSNIGEVVCILITSLLGLPECLIPVQLLWVNLITDGLPATALGFNPPPDNIMQQPPRNPKRPMIGWWQILRYCIVGMYVGLATIGGSLWWYLWDPSGPRLTFMQLVHHQHCSPQEPLYVGVDCQLFNHLTPMSISLSVLVLTEMFNACNSMSDVLSIVQLPPTRNKFLLLAIFSSISIHLATLTFPLTQKLFQVVPLSSTHWGVVLLFSFPVIILDEALKLAYRSFLGMRTSPLASASLHKQKIL